MCLVDVHVVGLQPLQRAVDRFHDVFAGQSAVIATGAGGPEDLGEYLQAFTALALQRPAEHRLGAGARVDVGRGEGGDARVQGRAHARGGRVLLNLGTVDEPIAIGDFTDDQAAAAEVTIFHGDRL